MPLAFISAKYLDAKLGLCFLGASANKLPKLLNVVKNIIKKILSDIYFDSSEENKIKHNHILNQHNMNIDDGMPLEWGEKAKGYRAVTLEHYKTYEHIIKDTNFKNVLILEDDVMFDNDFIEHLNSYTKELPIDYDICYDNKYIYSFRFDSEDGILWQIY